MQALAEKQPCASVYIFPGNKRLYLLYIFPRVVSLCFCSSAARNALESNFINQSRFHVVIPIIPATFTLFDFIPAASAPRSVFPSLARIRQMENKQCQSIAAHWRNANKNMHSTRVNEFELARYCFYRLLIKILWHRRCFSKALGDEWGVYLMARRDKVVNWRIAFHPRVFVFLPWIMRAWHSQFHSKSW